jgi:hypothetical protein
LHRRIGTMEPTVEPADATAIDSAKWGATQMPPITAVRNRTETASYPGRSGAHPLGGDAEHRGGRAPRSIRNGGSHGSGWTVSLPVGFDPNRGKPRGAHTAPSCLRMHVRDRTPWPPRCIVDLAGHQQLYATGIVAHSRRSLHRHPWKGCRCRLAVQGSYEIVTDAPPG